MFKDSTQSIVDLFVTLLVLVVYDFDLSLLGILLFQKLSSSVNSLLSILRILPNEEAKIECNCNNNIETEPEQTSRLKVLSEVSIKSDSDLWEEVSQDNSNESLHREGNGNVVNVGKLEDVSLTQRVDIVEKSLQNSAEINGLNRYHEILNDIDNSLEGKRYQDTGSGAHVFKYIGPNESREDFSDDKVIVEVKDDISDLVFELDTEVIFKDILDDNRVPIR